MLERVLINELVELGFDLCGHFSGSATSGTVQEAAGAFLSKALDPFSEGRVRDVTKLNYPSQHDNTLCRLYRRYPLWN